MALGIANGMREEMWRFWTEFYLMQLLVLRAVLALISHWPANWLLCLAFILNSQTMKFERNFPRDLNV